MFASRLSEVVLPTDVYAVCLTHAMSTEHEEVMGLLLGTVMQVDAKVVAKIESSLVLCRSDRRKDRVEISPEQLVAATEEAELAKQTGLPLKIIGWYHSHPHITVWPSHVDVRTQSMYQGMEATFVGLIFSCFSDEQDKSGKIEATCFQSMMVAGELQRVEIPLVIMPKPQFGQLPFEALVNLPRILYQEERESFDKALEAGGREDPLRAMYSNSVYQRALCELLHHVNQPLLSALAVRKEMLDAQQARHRRNIGLYSGAPQGHA